MSRPRPDNNLVLLWCEADVTRETPRGAPTWHDFLTTRETHVRVMRPDNTLGPPEPAWEFVYRCRKTHTDRRYGIEERLMS